MFRFANHVTQQRECTPEEVQKWDNWVADDEETECLVLLLRSVWETPYFCERVRFDAAVYTYRVLEDKIRLDQLAKDDRFCKIVIAGLDTSFPERDYVHYLEQKHMPVIEKKVSRAHWVGNTRRYVSLIEFLYLYDQMSRAPKSIQRHFYEEESLFLQKVHARTKWTALRALDIHTFKTNYDTLISSNDDAQIAEFATYVLNYKFTVLL